MRLGFSRRPWSASATRRATLGAFATTLFLAILPPLTGSFYGGLDLRRIDGAWLCELRRKLLSDEAIGFSADLGGGTPTWWDPQSGMFNPIRWLQLLPPPEWGLSLGTALQLALAAAGAAWLARTYAVGALVCACAGIAFAFSGTTTDLILHGTYLSGAVFLPAAWAASRRALHHPDNSVPALLLVGALVGCLVGAEPQAFVLACALAGFESLRCYRKLRWRGILLVGTAAVAAFSIGLLVWSPALAEMQLGPRGETPVAFKLAWSFGPPSWLAAVWPGVLVEPLDGDTNWWLQLNASRTAGFPWNRNPYLGPLLLALVVISVRTARARGPLLVGAIVLLVSMGDSVPGLERINAALFSLWSFRYPAKLFLVVTAAAIVAGALGVQGLLRNMRSLHVARVVVIVALISHVVAIGVLVAASTDNVAAPGGSPLHVMFVSAAARAMMPLLVALPLLWLPAAKRQLVVVVVALDLVAAAALLVPFGPPVFGTPSSLEPLRSARPVVCHHPSLASRRFADDGKFGDHGQDAFFLDIGLPNLNACADIAAAPSYSVFQSRLNARLETGLTQNHVGAARALGCTHFMTEAPPVGGSVEVEALEGLAPFIREDGAALRLYRLTDPVPPVFVARSPSLYPTEDSLFERIKRAPGPEELVALLDDPLHRIPPDSPLPDGRGASLVDIRTSQPGAVEVSLDGAGGAVVGIRTAFLGGWSARQAGRDLVVLRSGGNQLAAVVEDVRRGTVVFEYRPPAMGRGVAGMCGGLVLLAGLWRFSRRLGAHGNRRFTSVGSG